MLRFCVVSLALCFIAARLPAAEMVFDFEKTPQNETPPGFLSTVAGQGRPASWKIVLDEVTPLLAPLTEKAPAPKRAVLALRSDDLTDEHFPLLIYEQEQFGDFTFTTRFKIVGGVAEQMAGVVFRYQDEKNFYYIRASALGGTFRFFKVVEGQRSAPIGPQIPIQRGAWHELSVECKGNQIRCLLNGSEVIPPLSDSSFAAGKIGFIGKSDSSAQFVDARVVYTPRETLAAMLVRDALKEFPRLVAVKIYASKTAGGEPVIVASTDTTEVGAPADAAARDTIQRSASYVGRGQQTVSATLPLHDRNGDTVAAVRVVMKSFPGQTEQNVLARALPVAKRMALRVRSTRSLLE